MSDKDAALTVALELAPNVDARSAFIELAKHEDVSALIILEALTTGIRTGNWPKGKSES